MPLRTPLSNLGTSGFSLAPGESWLVPQGRYNLSCGRFCFVQRYDVISNTWLPFVGPAGVDTYGLQSDGASLRISNPTGCPVAAYVTNGGSGYTSAPVVTPSEGRSKWLAIMGQTVSSISVLSGGSGYSYPPLVIVQAPSFGYAATAYATLTGSSVSGITMVNVGAGYTVPPAVSVINDPRDNTGSGCNAVPVLGNSGSVTGVVCTDPYGGVGITSGTVPTLAFSGGGGTAAAAIALMAWTVTSLTVTGGGAGYDASGMVGICSYGSGMPTATAATYTNPRMEGGAALLRTRQALIQGTTGAGGTITAGVITDGGITMGLTNYAMKIDSNAVPSTVATLALVVGGATDVVYAEAI